MKTTTNKIKKPVFDREGYQTNIEDLNGEPLPDLEKLTVRRLHGGARVGAGRKTSGRQPVLLRLNPRTKQALSAAAKRRHVSMSDIAEEALANVL